MRRTISRPHIASFLAATLLSSCNSTTLASRSTATTSAASTASVSVGDGTQAVQVSSTGAFNVSLPAGALAGFVTQLGKVTVTGQAGATGTLSAADQATA